MMELRATFSAVIGNCTHRRLYRQRHRASGLTAVQEFGDAVGGGGVLRVGRR